MKQFITEVNVTKSASGLNNEAFCPSFASVNEANDTALHCCITDVPFTNCCFLSIASWETTKVSFTKSFPSSAYLQ